MLHKVRIITSGIVMAGVAGLMGHGATFQAALDIAHGAHDTKDRK